MSCSLKKANFKSVFTPPYTGRVLLVSLQRIQKKKQGSIYISSLNLTKKRKIHNISVPTEPRYDEHGSMKYI